MVLFFGRKAEVPCGQVSLFGASLIAHEWLRSAKHLPATRCRCGAHYYSWRDGKAYDIAGATPALAAEER